MVDIPQKKVILLFLQIMNLRFLPSGGIHYGSLKVPQKQGFSSGVF